MDEQPSQETKPAEEAHLSEVLARIAEQSRDLVVDFLKRHHVANHTSHLDPLNIGGAFLEMTARLMTDPTKLVQAQMSLWQSYMDLWQSTTKRLLGDTPEPVAVPDRDDRRFRHEAWEDNQLFDFIKQSYLLSARWIQSTVRDVEGLDESTAKKVDFYTRQFVDALAPSNFLLTNPEVLHATIESGGQNLVKGLDNLLKDLDSGEGRLKITMTDSDAFRLGKNLAITPGKVVFQTDLMQLLQYEPATETVARRPLLIVPPWINKYYVLDLRPENSLIKWLVDQGFTVFCISWVNPDEQLAEKTFDDYMQEGPVSALAAIRDATGETEVNAVGYCLGGTLLVCTLAYLAKKKDKRVRSATLLATLTDFSDPGELGIFIDEVQLDALEQKMKDRGYLSGREMSTTFNLLRANDLIWSFVVDNYLLGKEPFPFDLLFWNEDSTRMPAAMHSFYLRNMYQDNCLVIPDAMTLSGERLDVTKIETPVFILSAKEDHIAPWHSTYRATQLFSGPRRFVLANSGHIAGIINPPVRGKYAYWTNSRLPKHHEAWLKAAERHEGSWWPEWLRWLNRHKGPKVAARRPGDGVLDIVEEAPGSYVRLRI